MKQFWLYVYANGMYELECGIKADTPEQAKEKAQKMGYDTSEDLARITEELM